MKIFIERKKNMENNRVSIESVVLLESNDAEPTMVQLRKALNIYEVKGDVTLLPMNNMLGVFISGKYYGVWDCERQTFID